MNNEENKRRPGDGPRVYGFYRSVQTPTILKQLEKLNYQQCSHIYDNWAEFTRSFPREGDVFYIYDLFVLHSNLKGVQKRVKFLMNKGINIQLTRPDIAPLPPLRYAKPTHAAWARVRAKADKKKTSAANEANRKRSYPTLNDELRFQKIFTDFLKYTLGENMGTMKERCAKLGEEIPSYYIYLDRYLENMQNGIWKYPAKIHEHVLSEMLSKRTIEKDKDGIWKKVKRK